MKTPKQKQPGKGLEKTSHVEEAEGVMKHQEKEDKLMHSVLDGDKDTLDEANIINEGMNNSLGSFTPDLMFDKFVNDYSQAKKIYGESIIRALTGYDPEYVEKNISIPEFQRQIKKRVTEKLREMRNKGLLDKNNIITNEGVRLASLVMYVEEIDNLVSHGLLGEKINEKKSIYGGKGDVRDFKRHDRYRDIALKRSIKSAIRRGHTSLQRDDLKTFERKAKGSNYIIYALDTSGSMRGNKIATCKKAGIALAFKAIDEKDKVGLILFGKEVETEIPPTDDFGLLLKTITSIRASSETNLKDTIERAILLFPDLEGTKHLILLTDAVPTAGLNPEQETLDAVSKARQHGITVSLIGINLDFKGKELAEKITQIGNGKLHIANELDEVDKIVLMDYYEMV